MMPGGEEKGGEGGGGVWRSKEGVVLGKRNGEHVMKAEEKVYDPVLVDDA